MRPLAHLGGRSSDGETQAIFARRQLEHGDCLSHRTLRVRHTMQLRLFGLGVLSRRTVCIGELTSFSELALAPDPVISAIIPAN